MIGARRNKSLIGNGIPGGKLDKKCQINFCPAYLFKLLSSYSKTSLFCEPLCCTLDRGEEAVSEVQSSSLFPDWYCSGAQSPPTVAEKDLLQTSGFSSVVSFVLPEHQKQIKAIAKKTVCIGLCTERHLAPVSGLLLRLGLPVRPVQRLIVKLRFLNQQDTINQLQIARIIGWSNDAQV